MEDYNHEKCVDIAKFCSLAYLDNKEACDLAKKLGADVVQFYDVDGSQAYLLYTKYGHVVVFRGTEVDEFVDILSDVDIDLVDSGLDYEEPVMVHHGFKNATDKLRDSIFCDLSAYCVYKPIIAGHSLGGAMATMFSCYMNDNKDEIESVWTFGSPCVGNSSLVDYYRNSVLWDRTFRVVNNNDLVPVSLQLELLRKFDFQHVGRFFYIKEMGGWPVEDPSDFVVLADKAFGVIMDVLESGIDGIKDHSIDGDRNGYIYSLTR